MLARVLRLPLFASVFEVVEVLAEVAWERVAGFAEVAGFAGVAGEKAQRPVEPRFHLPVGQEGLNLVGQIVGLGAGSSPCKTGCLRQMRLGSQYREGKDRRGFPF